MKSNVLKKIPFHPFLLAVYFPLALLASNLLEANPVTIIRPILLMTVFACLLIFPSNLIYRNWRKSSVITSSTIFFFSIYGLFYSFIRQLPLIGNLFGRHRILIVILVLIFIFIGWLLWKIIRDLDKITLLFNLFAIFLIVMPGFQVILFLCQKNVPDENLVSLNQQNAMGEIQGTSSSLPDVYYIILDSYDRQDYLQSEFDFDNSDFLDFLRNSGFFVAECSRSNYAHTFLSLSSTLNMKYIEDLIAEENLTEKKLKDLLVHSQVRQILEQYGYQTVAFDNVHWDFSDADVFYKFEVKPLLNPYLFPLESAFIENSALKIVKDFLPDFQKGVDELAASAVKNHYYLQKYLFDSLDDSIRLSSPKFVFAHIEKPHGPYVFEPNGQFIEEDAFYRDKYFAAINSEYDRKGYVKQVQYANRRISAFIRLLQEAKKNNSIVVIQGDHGIQENEELNSRIAILYAVYLPEQNYDEFYPSITPVNTFRIILTRFFPEKFDLLDDRSYYSYRKDKMDYFPVQESVKQCLD